MEGPQNNLPQEIKVEVPKLKTNEAGKQYLYREYIDNGIIYYGGDYLDKTPDEIDLTMPKPPEEKNLVL